MMLCFGFVFCALSLMLLFCAFCFLFLESVVAHNLDIARCVCFCSLFCVLVFFVPAPCFCVLQMFWLVYCLFLFFVLDLILCVSCWLLFWCFVNSSSSLFVIIVIVHGLCSCSLFFILVFIICSCSLFMNFYVLDIVLCV